MQSMFAVEQLNLISETPVIVLNSFFLEWEENQNQEYMDHQFS